MHIDQNGVLEKAGKPIGIVKTICAPSVFDVEVVGKQSHAGGTTMEDRQDAFMATAEIALALEKLGHQIFVESELNQGTTIQILFPYLTYFTQDNEEKLISSH